MKNILFFILALGLFACKQDPDPIQPPTGCGMTIDQFPLKVGNSWTYEVFQSIDGGVPYRFYEKIKINVIRYELVDFRDTLFITENICFDKNNDTINYFINNRYRKSNNQVIPFFANYFDHSSDYISFPLICTNIDTIENFKDSDTIFSIISKETKAIKDTIFRFKNKNFNAIKCLRYEQTKLLEFSYDHNNVFQWYYIVPNIGVIQTEARGIHHYPYSVNFNYLYKLIDFKIL